MSKYLVGLSIGTYQHRYGDFRALEIAKEIGLDAVDFTLGNQEPDKEDSIYFKGDDYVRKYYGELGAYAKELGIIISQTHGRCASYRKDEDWNRTTLEKTRLDLIATKALGAPTLVVHNLATGRMGIETPAEEMRSMSFKMWMDMLPFAKKYGVKIATETFGDSPAYGCCDFFGRNEEFKANYNRVKATEYGEWFTACADTGHSNKAMRFGEPTPAEVIRQMKGEFTILHLNDNDTLTDQHKMPLSGTIDWQDVLLALKETGYSGVYNMELSLDRYGNGLAVDHGAFAVKVMRELLSSVYGD